MERYDSRSLFLECADCILAAQSDLKVATLGSPPKIRNKKLIEKR